MQNEKKIVPGAWTLWIVPFIQNLAKMCENDNESLPQIKQYHKWNSVETINEPIQKYWQ